MKNHLEKIYFIRDGKNISSKKGVTLRFYNPKQQFNKRQAFLIPNIAEFMHDVTENGQIGALKKRVLQLSFPDILKLIWWNKGSIKKVLKKDFASGILILLEIEVLRIQKEEPVYTVLSDYITDLALALNNKAIYLNFVGLMKRVNQPICFFTNNLPLFIDKCLEWQIHPDLIFSPINRSGYEMNPDKEMVESCIKRIAEGKMVAVVTVEDRQQLEYLKKQGISKILLNWFG